MDSIKRTYNEKIKAKKLQLKAIMDMCNRELAELRKKQGPERKMRKTDPFYADYQRALEIDEERKALEVELKQALEDLKKSAGSTAFQSVPVQALPASQG